MYYNQNRSVSIRSSAYGKYLEGWLEEGSNGRYGLGLSGENECRDTHRCQFDLIDVGDSNGGVRIRSHGSTGYVVTGLNGKAISSTIDKEAINNKENERLLFVFEPAA